jgi:hypothetical protein
MLSFVDSHSSLSQKKDKNTDRSLAHSHQLSSSSRSSEKHALYPQQKPQNRTRKTTNNEHKREPPQTRKSNILSAPPQVQVSPYNNSSANQFNFNLQN